MQVGRHYNQKLLVVGRAPNGWDGAVRIDDREEYYRENAKLFIGRLGSDSLDWVDQQRGAPRGNTNRMALWRLTRSLAAAFNGNLEDSLHYAAHTNLYKMAPDGGNPGPRLMDTQFDACVKIPAAEIKVLRREVVVFLTGYDWAAPFLNAMGITTSRNITGCSFVEFATRSGTLSYVVSQHPMMRQEQPHLEDISSVVRRLQASP